MTKRLSDFIEDKDWVSSYELEKEFIDYLNEIYPIINICGYDYESARVLKNHDPVAFREGFNNWIDHQVSECILVEKDDEYYRA